MARLTFELCGRNAIVAYDDSETLMEMGHPASGRDGTYFVGNAIDRLATYEKLGKPEELQSVKRGKWEYWNASIDGELFAKCTSCVNSIFLCDFNPTGMYMFDKAIFENGNRFCCNCGSDNREVTE